VVSIYYGGTTHVMTAM